MDQSVIRVSLRNSAAGEDQTLLSAEIALRSNSAASTLADGTDRPRNSSDDFWSWIRRATWHISPQSFKGVASAVAKSQPE